MSFRVVVCGGGVAAAEALLRLRRLAADAIELSVIARPKQEPARCRGSVLLSHAIGRAEVLGGVMPRSPAEPL
jgi:hypothetical protein